MGKEMIREVPVRLIEKLKEHCNNAKNPTVVYTEDVSKMAEVAKRKVAYSLLLLEDVIYKISNGDYEIKEIEDKNE